MIKNSEEFFFVSDVYIGSGACKSNKRAFF